MKKSLFLMVLCGALLAPAAFAGVSTSAGASMSDGVTAPVTVFDELAPALVAMPAVDATVLTPCAKSPQPVATAATVLVLYEQHRAALRSSQLATANSSDSPASTAEGVPKRGGT